MTTQTFPCRICGGQRPHNGSRCLGCATPIENARDRSTTKRSRVCCPKCGMGSVERRPDDSYLCNRCGAWFEPDDEPIDNRPDVAAQKRERMRKCGRGPRVRRYS